jgi:AraC-like DNA-binding protein
MSVVVSLDQEVPARQKTALDGLSGLAVLDGERNVLVSTDGTQTSLRVERVDVQRAAELTATSPAHPLLVLIQGVIDDVIAARLEDAGVAYVDAAGRAWFPGTPKTRTASVPKPSTAETSLRPAAIAVAQLLADHPTQRWTERSLADRSGASPATAHRVLSRLENEGLLVRTGVRRGAKRHVGDIAALRRWLMQHARPARPAMVRCYLPEPTTGDFGDAAVVMTGAAAADALGMPVLTGITRTLLRVNAPIEQLDDMPARLGGFRTTRGVNAILIADPHSLAARDARKAPDGRLVAPPSRVMLDLHLEPRGGAAAEVFLDLWGNRDARGEA